MPKIVDHDARRAEIVRAFLRLAARDGLAAVTTRSLAAELGVASGALWRYFADFDALLDGAFETVYADTNDRIDAATAGRSGTAAIEAMMREILPLVPLTRSEAAVVVGFWGRFAASDRFRARRLAASTDWHARFGWYLRQAIADDEVEPDAPTEAIADVLVAIASGQQVEFVTSGPASTPERQIAMVRATLAAWRPRSAIGS